jgi:electron transfer flavoprotein alpha/beta subunit
MGAKKKPQDVLGLDDIGVEAGQAGDAGSKTTVLMLLDPPPRGESRRIDGDADAAQAILDFLAEKKLL